MKNIGSLRVPWLSDGANDDRVRDAFAAVLTSWVGLGPKGNRERWETYARTLYDNDLIAQALAMSASQSTCAITSIKACEALGARMRWHGDPYVKHLGKAVSMALAIGRSLGSYVSVYGRVGAPAPCVGCVVFIGGARGQQEHLLNVIAEAPEHGPDAYVCVEGGQPDVDGPDEDSEPDGAIQATVRKFPTVATSRDMVAWSLSPKTGLWVPGRVVNGWFDVATLTLAGDAEVPDDFE
jgi:hypothetical protein